MTSKTARFLAVVESNPGITAAELHRMIGDDYAHGHHKFSYETIARMRRNGLIERCSARPGLRGQGYRVKPVSMPIRWVHSDKSVSTIGC